LQETPAQPVKTSAGGASFLRRKVAKPKPLRGIVETFIAHAHDLAAKSGLHVLLVAPPQEVFALGDSWESIGVDPPIDELQEPAPDQNAAPATRLNFHDLFKAQAIDLQCALSNNASRYLRRLFDKSASS